jgi:hypothetical protein
MKLWEEKTADVWDNELPKWCLHCVLSYGARTIRGGDSMTIHGSLLSARIAAFLAVLRGDGRVEIVSARTDQ